MLALFSKLCCSRACLVIIGLLTLSWRNADAAETLKTLDSITQLWTARFPTLKEDDVSMLLRVFGHHCNGPARNELSFLDSGWCPSTTEVVSLLGLNNRTVSGTKLSELCPLLINAVVSSSCIGSTQSEGYKSGKMWGISLAFTTLINLLSLSGAVFVPFSKKAGYSTVLLFMVSMAVGVLAGNGLLHLIPDSLGLSMSSDHTVVWKGCVAVLGVYVFFLVEGIMKLIHSIKEDDRRLKEAGLGEDLYVHLEDNGTIDPNKTNSDHVFSNGVETRPGDGKALPSERQCLQDHGRSGHHHGHSHGEPGEVSSMAWLVIAGDTLHNFVDGIAIGASFSEKISSGISTCIAVVSEELPHELGDFAVLINSGMSVRRALMWNFAASMACYAGLIIGIMAGSLPVATEFINAFAGGMFLYIALTDMLPESIQMCIMLSRPNKTLYVRNFIIVCLAMAVGFVLMMVLALYGSSIKL